MLGFMVTFTIAQLLHLDKATWEQIELDLIDIIWRNKPTATSGANAFQLTLNDVFTIVNHRVSIDLDYSKPATIVQPPKDGVVVPDSIMIFLGQSEIKRLTANANANANATANAPIPTSANTYMSPPYIYAVAAIIAVAVIGTIAIVVRRRTRKTQ